MSEAMLLKTAHPANDHVTLTWANGETSRFHFLWLRDNCRHPSRYSTKTGERIFPTEAIPSGVAARAVHCGDGAALDIEWNDGEPASRFDASWLWANRYDGGAQTNAANDNPATDTPSVIAWDRGYGDHILTFEHDAVLDDPKTLIAMIDAFRSHGLIRIRGVAAETGEVERFANKLAYVREIIFDRVADIIAKPVPYTQGFTSVPLPVHTDCSSYAWPPNAMLFHCLANDVIGGESLYADGELAIRRLRESNPRALEALTSLPVRYRLYSAGADLRHEAPPVTLDAEGNLQTLRFANWTVEPVTTVGFDQMTDYYDAHRALADMLNDPANQIEVRPEPGELLMLNNQRVVHGRKGYDPTSGTRHYQQVYMELDDLVSLRRVTADRRAGGVS